LAILLDLLGEALAGGAIFIIDSMPLPVCRRARAWRCRKVRGTEYCGYCAAQKEKFFGWRLHLVVTPQGIPVSFDLLPASCHDLTPIHELMERLPTGACVYADKGYNSGDDEAWIEGETGIRLIPRRRENMEPNAGGGDVRAGTVPGAGGDGEQPVGSMGRAAAARAHPRGLAVQGTRLTLRPPLCQRRLAITVSCYGGKGGG